MRRLIPALLISVLLLLALPLLVAVPSSAQEPIPPPAKGPEPTPGVPASPTPQLLASSSPHLPKIEPQLLKKLLESGNQPVPFIVYLKATTDISAAVASAAPGISPLSGIDPLTARRTAIVNALQETARTNQAGVLQTLNVPPPASGLSLQEQANPSATDIRPLWIVNAVAAKGSLDMVLALAARPDVEIVRLDKEIKLEEWRTGGLEDWRIGGLEDWKKETHPPTFQPSNPSTFQPSNLPTLQPSHLPTFPPSNLPNGASPKFGPTWSIMPWASMEQA